MLRAFFGTENKIIAMDWATLHTFNKNGLSEMFSCGA